MKIFKVRPHRSETWYKAGQVYEVEEYNPDYYRRSGMDDFILKADCERVDDELFETIAKMTKAQVQSDPFTRMQKLLDEGIANLMGILEIIDKLKEENDGKTA